MKEQVIDRVSVEERGARVFDLGSIDQVPVGQGRCFMAGARVVAVFRLRGGQMFALDNACPHRRGPLSEGVIGIDHASKDEAVICPYHGYRFSLRNGRGLDTELNVRTYAVEIRADRIVVRIE
jgi:nitrite reductase (NADH) small subunit